MGNSFNSLLEAALHYAELGYPVFPCEPGGKHPLTEHGFKDATTDNDQITAWWTDRPNANIGLATARILVLDEEAASAWLTDAPDKQLDLAVAPMANSARGGRHRYFRQPKGKSWPSTAKKIAPHVDTRANGGYAVLPPSVIEGKRAYTWQETMELDVPPGELPEPPAWLVELLDGLATGSPQGACVAPGTPDGNGIPDGQRNATLARLGGNMRRVGMTEAEILTALTQVNQDRCNPPLDEREVRRIASSVARYEPDQISVAVVEDHYSQDFGEVDAPYISARELCRTHKEMRKPLIHGLLREGETMNVIAAPKTGKSWLVLNLGLSVVTGMPWLEFPTEPGRVLLIDNELHAETLANRIPRVAEAMGLPESTWMDGLHVKSVRGCLVDLFRMEAYFQALPEGFFNLIVLDVFYRFMPKGMDENDNGTMANLYNVVDRCAARLKAGFVLIHHTTKGLQSGKSVTDVGAGAGSQSRAADSHFILRPHEEDGCLSVDAVARSWPPPEPFVIRKSFPLWEPDLTLDPADLKKPYPRSRKQRESEEGDVSEKVTWTPDAFVEQFIGPEPKTKAALFAAANDADLSDYKAGKLLRKAEAIGLIHRWHLGGNRPGFATVPQEKKDDDAKSGE